MVLHIALQTISHFKSIIDMFNIDCFGKLRLIMLVWMMVMMELAVTGGHFVDVIRHFN